MARAEVDAFYKENMGLVRRVAIKVHARALAMGLSLPYDDIEQEASIVFLRAYEGFNPDLGFKFSTYFTKSAYNQLNKYLETQGGKDREELGLFSMHAAVHDDGEPIDMESMIEGDFDTPEECLEEKQLIEYITNSISPLANQMIQFVVDPPPELQEEFQASRSGSDREYSAIPLSFVCSFAERVMGATPAEMRAARAELQDVRRFLNESK